MIGDIQKVNVNIHKLTQFDLLIQQLDGLQRCRQLTMFTMESCDCLVDTQGWSHCLEVISLINSSVDEFRGLGYCPRSVDHSRMFLLGFPLVESVYNSDESNCSE
jgi:hypothetical protein